MALAQTLIYLRLATRFVLKNPGFSSVFGVCRDFGKWLKHSRPDSNSVKASIPWLTFSAIAEIEKKLTANMKVFEYGSGGSTLFWAARTKFVVSVEHDKSWYLTLTEELQKRRIENVNYLLIEPIPDNAFSEKSPANPHDYISDNAQYKGTNFEAYVKKIDEFEDHSFDIIIVDGRARTSCMLHAMKKIKPSGYLILDNSERDYYLSNLPIDNSKWKRTDYKGAVPFSTYFSQTTIFQNIQQ
ncbi:MAG: hypothetical protein EOO04_20820 [Chitinophagaceae bacterium]|nr:MAG: hypothetical protein EOO04_20820 [Chitinophagaceae bacterium]